MRIYITGVSGFIGRRLAQHFLDSGHRVLGCGSSPTSRSKAPEGLDRFDVLCLGETAPANTFTELDAVVHTAYNPAPGSEDLNVEGTDAWRTSAAQQGAQKQLFLTSHSADAAATSEYGRQKFRLETLFLEHGHQVARCGLVIGNGGLFQRMMTLISRLPILPLLDGGKAPTLVTGSGDLVLSIERMLKDSAEDSALPKNANLFNPDPISLRDLLKATRRALRSRTFFLPIPSAILLPPLWIARNLGINLPVNEENVRGYRTNRAVERRSDYPSILDTPTPIATMIEIAADEFHAPEPLTHSKGRTP